MEPGQLWEEAARRPGRIMLAHDEEGDCDVCKTHVSAGDWFRVRQGQIVHLECAGNGEEEV